MYLAEILSWAKMGILFFLSKLSINLTFYFWNLKSIITNIAAMSRVNVRGRDTIELVSAEVFFYCCHFRLWRPWGFKVPLREINTLRPRKIMVYLYFLFKAKRKRGLSQLLIHRPPPPLENLYTFSIFHSHREFYTD